MGRPEIVIVADDLSGAADCGSAFAAQGLRTVVQLSGGGLDADAQVLAIDTATRAMTVEQASAAAKQAFEKHRDVRVFYKKIDSLLRGHVGPELAAMLRDAAPAVAVMAPALPLQGRVTRNGCQWLRGEPVAGGNAPELLEAAGLTARVVPTSAVRGGELAATLTQLAKQSDVLICDAETEEDLSAIAHAATALPREVVWVGSAGLARHIPSALGIASESPVEEPPPFRGPVVAVIGSRTAVAHEQVRNIGMNTIFVTPDQIRAGNVPLLDFSSDLAISIAATADRTEDPGLSAALAQWIAPHIDCIGDRIGALIVTGGETARAVLTRAGITGLRLLKEVEAGVPLAVSLGARSMPVITKSGSFGNPATLGRCVETLRRFKLESDAKA